MGRFNKKYETSEAFLLDACYPKNYDQCLKFIQNTLKQGAPYPGDFTHEKLVVLEFKLLTNIENTPKSAVKYAQLLEENIVHYVKLSSGKKKRKDDYLWFLPTAYIENLYDNLCSLGRGVEREKTTVGFVLSYLWIRDDTLEIVCDHPNGKRCYSYFADAEKYHDRDAVDLILPRIETALQELGLKEEYQDFKANNKSEIVSESTNTTQINAEPCQDNKSDYIQESTQTAKKPGKGKLVGRIFLKSLCVLFGVIIIAFALLTFFATEGQVPEDQRVSTLIGQVASGAFCFGLWLFYYGTIVALKKAGIQVRDDLKDPSFWEVVSVTTVTTYYSDGSKEEKKYSNIKGSFFGEIVIFLILFAVIQTYYFVAAPILGIISLFRDVKMLKKWN